MSERCHPSPSLDLLAGLLLVAFVGGGCSSLSDGLSSHRPRPDTESARRLDPGPFHVEAHDLVLVDRTRPTMANRDFPGASSRTLAVTVWDPEEAAGPRPLVVYAHGYTGSRYEMVYLLEHLASHGYVVAALDFPLTNGEAPGEPTARDLASQPGDVSFLIDSLLAGGAKDHSFADRIDPERIALVGLSYGGLTTTLSSFHPTERDPRLVAAVSVAGPSQMFAPRFFAGGGPSFLMVAGTEDTLVPYPLNAEPLPRKAAGASLVRLDGGTHLGFVDFASTWLRFTHNPDAMACEAIMERAGEGEMEDPFDPANGPDPFAPLGGPEIGVDFSAWTVPCSQMDDEVARAMRPQRQQLLTTLAIRAFLDARLDGDSEADRFFARVLPIEWPDVGVVSPELAIGGR